MFCFLKHIKHTIKVYKTIYFNTYHCYIHQHNMYTTLTCCYGFGCEMCKRPWPHVYQQQKQQHHHNDDFSGPVVMHRNKYCKSHIVKNGRRTTRTRDTSPNLVRHLAHLKNCYNLIHAYCPYITLFVVKTY